MRNKLFHLTLAIFLVAGVWFAANSAQPAKETTATAVEADAIDLRTGDVFWGLRLCGVVPCSPMLVRGGGHLVTLSFQNDGNAPCLYHVLGEKRITLGGREFRARVIAPDQIHVEREPASQIAWATP